MKRVRAFIALEISDEAKREIARVITLLKKADSDIKWLHEDAVHLTLKFLGDIDERNIPHIAEEIREIAREAPSFNLALGKDIGVFPGWKNPRVVWICAGDGCAHAELLAAKMDKNNHDFKPHFTLGRIRKQKNISALEKIAESITINPIGSYIPQIVIFASLLTLQGAIHTPLYTLPLKENKQERCLIYK